MKKNFCRKMQRVSLYLEKVGKLQVFSVEVACKEECRVVTWRGGKVWSKLCPECCS